VGRFGDGLPVLCRVIQLRRLGPHALQAVHAPAISDTALVTALDGAGSFSLGVGASFPLGSATPTGAYTGSFSVLAIYN
jgi:hypothetical protein